MQNIAVLKISIAESSLNEMPRSLKGSLRPKPKRLIGGMRFPPVPNTPSCSKNSCSARRAKAMVARAR